MDETLAILIIQDLISHQEWDDAFEWTKSLVQQGNPKGAELVTKLVRRTKWYDQGLALLSLNTTPEYMEQYATVRKLQSLERSRLSLWSKLPGLKFAMELSDPEDLTETELDEDELEDSDGEEDQPFAKMLELEILDNREGAIPPLPEDEHINVSDQKSIESHHILEVVGQKPFPTNFCTQLKVPLQTSS